MPLAVAMTAGPPLVAAVLLITGRQPVKTSLAFLAGALVMGVLGVALAMLAAEAFDALKNLQSGDEPSTFAFRLQIGLVLLLIAAAFKTFVNRHDSEMPEWLERLQTTSPAGAFKTAVIVYGVMPTKIATMLTVGINLSANDFPLSAAWAFWALALTILSLPLLAYLIFRARAERVMPKLRDGLAANSWAVKVFVYALFIWLILK